jgi:hypothetical protein
MALIWWWWSDVYVMIMKYDEDQKDDDDDDEKDCDSDVWWFEGVADDGDDYGRNGDVKKMLVMR